VKSYSKTPPKDKETAHRPQSLWFANLRTEEEKNALLKHLALMTGDPVLKRLKEIINQRLINASNEKEPYDSPAWAYKQADINGRRSELKIILDLLETI
jgi:hypothetical protein